MSNYFSDREHGPKARTEQNISPVVWAGCVGAVQSLLNSGAFGHRFPERCNDGQVICGADENAIASAVLAEIPGLSWPLKTFIDDEYSSYGTRQPFAPPTLLVLDFLEFVHRSIARPIPGKYHDYHHHHHLSFEPENGQAEFRSDVNRIFARNGVAYGFAESGQIERTLGPIIDDSLRETFFHTGDRILDEMLDESRKKFTSRDPLIRREALERLCDSWERLKSLADPANKRASIGLTLDRAASEPTFRAMLETEAKLLTTIANERLLRHSEVSQVPVIETEHVDYLFHRLFAMIQLLLRRQ